MCDIYTFVGVSKSTVHGRKGTRLRGQTRYDALSEHDTRIMYFMNTVLLYYLLFLFFFIEYARRILYYL